MNKRIDQTRKKYLLAYFIFLFLALYSINRDVFEFYDAYKINRNFTPEYDSKDRYFLTPLMTLKKGKYQVTFEYTTDNKGNGYFIESNQEIVFQDEFSPDARIEVIEYEVVKNSEQIQIGVTYDPESGEFLVEQISISSNYVMSRDSLMNHFVSTLFIIFLFLLFGWRFFFPHSWYQKWGRLSTPANERIIVFLLALAAFSSYTFFFDKAFLRTDDLMFHLMRIEGVKTSLLNGVFPARINHDFLYGYGYASGIFYPNVTLYFPAMLRIFGFDILTTYKISSILINLFSILSCYWTAYRIGKSRYVGLIASIFYGFASHRLIEMLFRTCLGEAQAFIYLPIIILGLYEIFTGHTEKWYVFALGFLGLIYTHLLSFAMAFVFVLFFLLFNIKTIITDKRILAGLLKSVGMVMVLSAFITLPLIEQSVSNRLKSNILLSSIYYTGVPGKVFLPGAHLFSPIAGWDLTSDANLGLPFLLLPLSLLFLKKSDHAENKMKAVLFIALGLIAAFIATEWFPWRLIMIAWLGNRLQFAWRFLVIAVPLLALGGGLVTDVLIKGKDRKKGIIAVLCFSILSSAPLFYNATIKRYDTTYPYHLEPMRVSGGEYLPEGVETQFIDNNKNTVLFDNPELKILSHDRHFLSFQFEYESEKLIDNQVEFQVPLLYYTGYQGTLTTSDGKIVPLETYRSPRGLVGVTVTDVTNGKIEVHYQKTMMQWIGDLITLFALIFLVGNWVRSKRRKAKLSI